MSEFLEPLCRTDWSTPVWSIQEEKEEQEEEKRWKNPKRREKTNPILNNLFVASERKINMKKENWF